MTRPRMTNEACERILKRLRRVPAEPTHQSVSIAGRMLCDTTNHRRLSLGIRKFDTTEVWESPGGLGRYGVDEQISVGRLVVRDALFHLLGVTVFVATVRGAMCVGLLVDVVMDAVATGATVSEALEGWKS